MSESVTAKIIFYGCRIKQKKSMMGGFIPHSYIAYVNTPEPLSIGWLVA